MIRIRSFGTAPAVDANASLTGLARVWRVAEEMPVALIYNGRNFAVMLATPADLADFAVGFSVSERMVERVDEIETIDIHHGEGGVDIRIGLATAALERFDVRQQRRNLVGRAGCGVCGVENAEVFFEPLPSTGAAPLLIAEEALRAAITALPGRQPLNKRTRTVHAAAYAAGNGDILLVREDVGRHNALDKLIGALKTAPAAEGGFVVMSSRCSYEIVEKCARAGLRAIVSLSAPTAFAIRKAEEANLSIYVRSGAAIRRVTGVGAGAGRHLPGR